MGKDQLQTVEAKEQHSGDPGFGRFLVIHPRPKVEDASNPKTSGCFLLLFFFSRPKKNVHTPVKVLAKEEPSKTGEFQTMAILLQPTISQQSCHLSPSHVANVPGRLGCHQQQATSPAQTRIWKPEKRWNKELGLWFPLGGENQPLL